jgi:hypothetical protein
MDLLSDAHPLLVVVGSGGVGKTTLAAALGVASARAGRDTLVMTFDPSLRLKQALGVGDEARERETPVALAAPGTLHAHLLDARRTFDRLVERYAPDEEARRRVLGNRFYQHLSGNLGGILEYMAVERLYEVASGGAYSQVVLDTPPTRQALDFLEAPARIVSFLDSGALKLALRPWFDASGRLKATARWGGLGRRAERFLDEVVGLELLRDMAEFYQAFASLYGGFRAGRGVAALAADAVRPRRRSRRGEDPGHPLLRPPARAGRVSARTDPGQSRASAFRPCRRGAVARRGKSLQPRRFAAARVAGGARSPRAGRARPAPLSPAAAPRPAPAAR